MCRSPLLEELERSSTIGSALVLAYWHWRAFSSDGVVVSGLVSPSRTQYVEYGRDLGLAALSSSNNEAQVEGCHASVDCTLAWLALTSHRAGIV